MRSNFSTRSTPPNSSRGRWWTLRGRRNSDPPSVSATETAAEQAQNGSPLTDSNRRPPPYHAIKTATGGSQWKRFRASSGQFPVFVEPNLCHRLRPLCSITVPSQSAENGPFEVDQQLKAEADPFCVESGSSACSPRRAR